jgi:hypothetical protein
MGASDGAPPLRSMVGAKSQSLGANDKGTSIIGFVTSHRRLVECGAAVVIVGFLLVCPPQPIWIVFALLVILVLIVIGAESVASAASGEKSATDTVS